MLIVYFLLVVLFLLFLVTFTYGAVSAAPWLPTKKSDVKRVVELMQISRGDKFYEMGSGDGRLLAAVARSGAVASGFEVALFPYLLSLFRKLFLKQKLNYKVSWSSFWNADLSDADFVYIFLTPDKNVRVARKLKKEMNPGARVVSYVWPLEGWTPLKIDKKEDRVNIYLYEI